MTREPPPTDPLDPGGPTGAQAPPTDEETTTTTTTTTDSGDTTGRGSGKDKPKKTK